MPDDTYYQRYGKRAFDACFSALTLIVLSPLLLLVGIAVKCSSRGPVFFGQMRVGRSGRMFRLWKFRSMVDGADRLGPGITSAGDERVTTIGLYLRRWKIDELPQFWNVFLGQMSIVGPRPELGCYVKVYTDEQLGVLSVRPGLTDPASIEYRNEEQILAAAEDRDFSYRTRILPHKLALNLRYIDKISLTRDLIIILQTLSVVLFLPDGREDVHALASVRHGASHSDGVGTKAAGTLLRRNAWFVGAFQGLLVLLALTVAWLLRFDFSLPHRRLLLITAPLLVLVRLLFMARFRLLHGWWRYVGVRDTVDIAKAVLLGSLVFFVLVRYILNMKEFPRTIYVSEALITAGLLAGVRVLSRLLAETMRQDLASARKVVVVGAGAAAQMVVRELNQAGSGRKVIACLDDDPRKIGSKAQGVPVMGPIDRLPELFSGMEDECEVLVAIPSASGRQMARIVELAETAGLRYRTVPGLRELISRDVLLTQVREVNLDDLLGRDQVELDLDAVAEKIAGKVVMVTGAVGSIGSELCRQILGFAPLRLVCLDQNETGIFYLQQELTSLADGTELVFCVADVRDRERLRRVCLENEVLVVFHAAAYKHVPVMEANTDEAVRNNVFALLTLMDVAEEANCRDLVLISSDKAVNPTSVMGATKRVCELILAARPANGLRCVSVRFGNVLGSSGSVVPVFQEQLRRGLPITVTHPDIQRFFMTIQEAVSLVLQAFAIGSHGDILVLDMGMPIKIVDLARKLIRLAGKADDRVPIEFTGLRPGEKLTEDLFYPSEEIQATSHSKIKRARGNGNCPKWPELVRQLEGLRDTVAVGTTSEICARIRVIVPEYCSKTGEENKAFVTAASQARH
ncbi:MAG TPA: polysaccharide biosynthesis protein [Candidatus Angelobacter sp.]|nr:polysaccharide biosynthesis protein [Candidatus Angelobacter sp.]